MAVAARNEIHFIGADYLPDMAKTQGPGAGCRIQNWSHGKVTNSGRSRGYE
jgi:hypothetical protein